MKILITSGGTEEPIDGVRCISNMSTGKTGAFLAERFTDLGVQVTLLHGHRAALPQKEMEKDHFTTFRDLDERMRFYLNTGDFQAVIHLAAVGDFSLEYIEAENGERLLPRNKGKLSSEQNLKLHLKRNYKILNRLKNYHESGKELLVIGFKLTDTDSPEQRTEAVKKLFASGQVDVVVENTLREIGEDTHPARIYGSPGELIGRTRTKKEMADCLFRLIQGEEKDYDFMSRHR